MMLSNEFELARVANEKSDHISTKPMTWDEKLVDTSNVIICETKHDGITANWIGETLDSGRIVTNEGVEMRCCDHIVKYFVDKQRELNKVMYMVGEYMVDGDDWNKTVSAFTAGRQEGFIFIYDMVPIDVYYGRLASVPLIQRKKEIEMHFGELAGDIPARNFLRACVHVHIDPRKTNASRQDIIELIEDWFGVAVQEGQEGVVIKNGNSPFVRGKTNHWLKIKRNITADIEIQSVNIENGRVKSIHGIDPDNNIASVGAFREEFRYQMADWYQEGTLIGRIVEIKSQGITNGRHINPSFVRMRADKAVI